MIKIRTISYNLPKETDDSEFTQIKACADDWYQFSYPVRTQRLTLPFQTDDFDLQKYAPIAAFCHSSGIRWFNIPFDPWLKKISAENITSILKEYNNAFCNIICAKENQIRQDILDMVAKTIQMASDVTESGNTNFRLGASMNISSNGPFFPFTYSSGERLSFTIGLELAEEINRIVSQHTAKDLNMLWKEIVSELELQIYEIEEHAKKLSEKHHIRYDGIDFSLAPLPQEGSSVITILNCLGINEINGIGMMMATAYLTDLLKSFGENHKHVGFSGVMYSLLEDAEYAAINDRDGFSLRQMVSLSTMCGCGVDMVPIHRDTDIQSICTILMEIGCISSRLNKPLGVRLLPIRPNEAGRTNIDEDQDFIINTRLVSKKVNSVIGFGEQFSFRPYRRG